jgi:hypothetical protein
MVSSSTTAAEVKQMESHTDQNTVMGSPELALVAFAIVAVFAYILF